MTMQPNSSNSQELESVLHKKTYSMSYIDAIESIKNVGSTWVFSHCNSDEISIYSNNQYSGVTMA